MISKTSGIRLIGAVSAALVVLTGNQAHAADLLSGTVTISNNYPSETDVDSPISTGATTSPVCVYSYCFTFTANKITFTSGYNVTFTYAMPPDGNYFALGFSGVPNISDVTLDSTSDWSPISISFSDNDIYLNVSGVGPITIGSSSVYDVSFSGTAVPEPATWAMMLLGFGGIGAVPRISRRNSDPALTAAVN